MLQKAQQLKEQFSEKVAAATVPAELEQLRIEFLGKKGPISSLMGELRNIPNEQKKEAGQIINDVKQFIEDRPQNLARYGLDNPSVVFEITDGAGSYKISDSFEFGETECAVLMKQYFAPELVQVKRLLFTPSDGDDIYLAEQIYGWMITDSNNVVNFVLPTNARFENRPAGMM